MRLPLLFAFLLLVSLSAEAYAQGCTGRGNARLSIPSFELGQAITISLEAAPGAQVSWLLDTAPGDFPLAGGGSACLGFTNNLTYLLDARLGGPVIPANGSLDLPLIAVGLPTGALLYSQFAALDPLAPGGVAVSNPVSVQGTVPDWHLPTQGNIASLGTSLHTATSFGDGRYVLIAGGGRGGLISPTPEPLLHIYDHYLRTFTLQAAQLRVPRAVSTATLIQGGRILITGGTDGISNNNWDDGEVFDPVTGLLTPVLNPMQSPRGAHTATRLDDGRVLICGGNQQFTLTPSIAPIFTTASATTEIYNPLSNTFTPGPTMTRPRVGHSAVKLPNGEVLIVGGIDGGTVVSPTVALPTLAPDAEIFNPVTNTFRPAGTLFSPRFLGYLALLPSGNVLYAGGGSSVVLNSSSDAELWVSGASSWIPLPNMPVDTAFGSAVTLDDGRVALIGGASGTPFSFTALADVYYFDEVASSWTAGTPLPAARVNLTANRMRDGTYLIAGGGDLGGFALNTALNWNP